MDGVLEYYWLILAYGVTCNAFFINEIWSGLSFDLLGRLLYHDPGQAITTQHCS